MRTLLFPARDTTQLVELVSGEWKRDSWSRGGAIDRGRGRGKREGPSDVASLAVCPTHSRTHGVRTVAAYHNKHGNKTVAPSHLHRTHYIRNTIPLPQLGESGQILRT